MISEELMQPGQWDVVLSSDTPASIRQAIVARGHILVTPTDVGTQGFSDQDMKNMSIYTGRVDRVGNIGVPGESGMSIGGVHLNVWLGDADGRGVIFTTTKSFSAATWSAFIASILPPSISTGTVTNNPSAVTNDFFAMNAKAALDHQGPISGAEWRVNPDGTFDSGLVSDLFVTTPTVLATRESLGYEPNIKSLHSPNLDVSIDASKWLYQVHLAGKVEAAAGAEDIIMASADLTDISKSNPYKDFLGNADTTAALINDPVSFLSQAQDAAEAALLSFYDIDELVTLDLSEFYISGDFEVGDTIWVYHPPKIVNTANQIPWKGGVAFPEAIRVFARSTPIRRGKGIYYRSKDAEYTNLSPYVNESGAATIDVGVKKSSPIGTAQGIATTALNAHNQAPNITKEPYACRVRRSTDFTVPTNENTLVLFNSEDRDTYNMHSSGVVTAPVTGWYDIHAGWDWAGSSTSGKRTRCYVTAGGVVLVEHDTTDSLNNRVCNASTLAYLTAGQTIYSSVWHNIGSDATVNGPRTFLAVAARTY